MTVQKRKYTRGLSLSKVLAFLLMASILYCCRKEEITGITGINEFLERSDSGLYGHGGFLFKYDKTNCQLSINLMRKQIRMQSDDQTDYINMQFLTLPTTSTESVDVTLIYKVGNEEISNNCNMDIIKYQSDKLWLWDMENHLGIIIPAKWCGIE